MKTLPILVFLVLIQFPVRAQELAASEVSTNSQGTLEWAIGEVLMAESVNSNGYLNTPLSLLELTTVVSFDTNSIDIYPNPTSGLFNISLGGLEQYNIDIYNIAGRQVEQYNVTESEGSLKVSGLKTGVYQVRINYLEKIYIKKLCVL